MGAMYTRKQDKTYRGETARTPSTAEAILTTGAVALAGSALAVEAAQAQAGPKGIFSVATTTIPIVGETTCFPVRRIYCIGRNYAAHARAWASDPTREPPFFFQKPTDAIQNVAIGEVADHPYPSLTKNYHYEVELVAALKSGGTNIPRREGARPCLWLRRRARHDAPRPAARHGRREEAVGDRQELRPMPRSIGPIHPVAKAGGHLDQGRDLARGQRHR